ncbi:MAG: hypothetical protein C3F17_04450 [Bradyrhizobiaceae bacterium]|nr:MAG: hypothetical protein C3F17_04450 [Bradyrhizobiaceae bacterium]
MAEYEAHQAAVLERTEKLRAQRLAREAEQVRSGPAPAKKKKSAKSAKNQAGSLSDWLNDQRTSGRRS